MARLARLRLVALAFVAALAGCSHYQLGTRSELAFSSLYIAPVGNEATVPQAVALVTREVRLAFLRDGRVQLAASPEAADAVLTVTLADYGREMTTSRARDTGLARKFDVTLAAVCTLTDARTGEIYFTDRPITSTRQVFTDEGQLPAEYQTLPQLAQLLADRVAHAVLDVW